MLIYSIMIAAQNPSDSKVYIYSREYNLASFGFLVKNTVKDSFKFLCRSTLLNVEKGTRHSLEHEKKYGVHIQVSGNSQLAGYAFCDTTYPRRVAFKMLNEIMAKFEKEIGSSCFKFKGDENIDIGLASFIKTYSEPKNFDNIIAAQDKADKIAVQLHENLEMLIERGENLDNLVAKSNDLNAASKQFYKTTKKMNKKCCIIF